VSFTKTLRVPVLVSIFAALLLVPAGAASAAKRCEAPPGTAGTDQYCETLPGGTGDSQSTGGPWAGKWFTRRTQGALERSGRDGRGVLELPSSGGQAQAGQKEKAEAPVKSSGSALGSLGSALESGSSAGPVFIWLLVAAGLGMAGIAWLRYRRGSRA